MLYDALIFDCENVIDLDDPAVNSIRINRLNQQEAEALSDILLNHETNVCLFPHKE